MLCFSHVVRNIGEGHRSDQRWSAPWSTEQWTQDVPSSEGHPLGMAVDRISYNSGAWVTDLIFRRLKKLSWGRLMALSPSGMSGALPGGRDAPYSYRRSARSILYLERDKFLSRTQGSASPLQLRAQAEHQRECMCMCYCVFMWVCLCTCAGVSAHVCECVCLCTRVVEQLLVKSDLSVVLGAKYQSPSHIRLFSTLWKLVHQAPLSMEFSRKEC